MGAQARKDNDTCSFSFADLPQFAYLIWNTRGSQGSRKKSWVVGGEGRMRNKNGGIMEYRQNINSEGRTRGGKA